MHRFKLPFHVAGFLKDSSDTSVLVENAIWNCLFKKKSGNEAEKTKYNKLKHETQK
jgi:hypothetical protein